MAHVFCFDSCANAKWQTLVSPMVSFRANSFRPFRFHVGHSRNVFLGSRATGQWLWLWLSVAHLVAEILWLFGNGGYICLYTPDCLYSVVFCVCISVYICICIVSTYIYIYIYRYIYIYMCVCMYVCIWINTYFHIYIYICLFVHMQEGERETTR